MNKRKRKRPTATGRATTATHQARPTTRPEWRWRTFPVFFAFFVGLLAASLVNPPEGDIGFAVQLAALLGVGYGVGHLIVTNVLIAGRTRRAEQRDRDGDYVDEVVHPDDDHVDGGGDGDGD